MEQIEKEKTTINCEAKENTILTILVLDLEEVKKLHTVAVTGEVYLHQDMGLGRAEQNCTLCLPSFCTPLYTCPADCPNLQLTGLSRGCFDFVVKRTPSHKTTYGTGFVC